LTRDQKRSSLTRRSVGPPSKEGKAKSKFLSDASAGIAEFPVLMEFLDPPEIASNLQIKYAIPITRDMTRYREIKNATAEVVGVRLVKKASTARAHAAIRDVIVANPALTYQQIADLLGCSRWLIYRVAAEFNVRRPRGAGSPSRRKEGQ
jgi:hypothetical protein